MSKKTLTTAAIIGIMINSAATAQDVAIKNNLLYDATLSPNLGIEIALSEKQTIQMTAGFNPWKFKNGREVKHWVISPEYRWWTCSKFNGSFIAAHLLGGHFDINHVQYPFRMWSYSEKYKYTGWIWAIGVAYGYQWLLSKHWNIEAEIGVGYMYMPYKRYRNTDLKNPWAIKNDHLFVPTKAGISIVYLF